MSALRRLDPQLQRPDDRRRLRALADAFPGALRELDRLPADEIERRAVALDAAAGGAPLQPWMAWMAGYHRLMQAALACKARLAGGSEDAAALATEIAASSGAPIDTAFVHAVAAPPHGRLNVVVFARLAELFAVPAATIWETLFPKRSGRGRHRE